MGKKKQKVRWSAVDGLKWSTNEDDSSPEGSLTGKEAYTHHHINHTSNNNNYKDSHQQHNGQSQYHHNNHHSHQAHHNGYTSESRGNHGGGGGGGRRQSQPWTHGVAPRFERKSQGGNGGASRQIYYDGEYCDAEEMPNGFTKIRSKNLDILFKRDYYEHRLTQSKAREETTATGEEEGEGEADTTTPENDPPTAKNGQTVEAADYSGTVTAETNGGTVAATASRPFRSCKSFDQIDPAEIPEFRPMNSLPATSVSSDPETELNSGEQSPYYPPYWAEQAGPGGAGYGYSAAAPPRPNLYLYSPTNNTLIPCEEIIIPAEGSSGGGSGGSSSGGGTPYPSAGPANIYLAYPVQGPDGRGYITQQFSPPIPGEPYHHPHHQPLSYPCYSPSMSLDGSQYHSSTPQTPNSGQDSGSSTQPTSPPPLHNYHPANWFPNLEQHHHSSTFQQDFLPDRTAAAATAAVHAHPRPAEPAAPEPLIPPHELPPSITSSGGCRRANSKPVPTSSPPSMAVASATAASSASQSVRYIPGLPPGDSRKKSQKKKKSKKLVSSSSSSSVAANSGHRGSVSSDGGLPNSDVSSITDAASSQVVVEVHLTDDLADYMVNPPTDPEVSDEETTTLVSGVAENIESLPRDDTICNLDDLPMERAEDVVDDASQNEGAERDNLGDSGIELESFDNAPNEKHLSCPVTAASTDVMPFEEELFEEDLCNTQDEPTTVPSSPQPEEAIVIVAPSCDDESEGNNPQCEQESKDSVETEQDLPSLSQEATEQPAAAADIPTEVASCLNNSNGCSGITVAPVLLATAAVPAAEEAAIADSATNDVDNKPLYVPGKPKKKKTKKKSKAMSPPIPDATVLEPTPSTAVDIPPQPFKENAAGQEQQRPDFPEIPTEAAVVVAAPVYPSSPPKMSYSAVCKTSDSAAEQSSRSTISTSNGCSSSIKSQSVPAATQAPSSKSEERDKSAVATSRRLTAAATDSEADAAAKEAAEWETVPPGLVSNPGQWEKKRDRKRKKKTGNNAATVVAFDDVPQVFEVEAGDSITAAALPELEPVKLPEKDRSPPPPAEEAEETEDKKRTRRKKKKQSQEPEEPGRRVIIHDNQIEIRLTRVVRRASDVLGVAQVEEVRRSGYCDVLVVDQLGSGISRGSIHNGRLYKGKYVPPARVDGLLSSKVAEEEEAAAATTTKEIDNATESKSTAAADIDLD